MPKRVRPEVELKLAELVYEHRDWTPKRFADAINAEFPQVDPNAPPAVSERWIRDKLPSLRDRSDYWTLRPGERDVRFVLDVIATQFGPGNRLPRLTVDEVSWLRAVHAVAPDMEAAAALRWARLYMAVSNSKDWSWFTHVLDLALAQGVVEPTTDLTKWLDGKPSPISWYGGKED